MDGRSASEPFRQLVDRWCNLGKLQEVAQLENELAWKLAASLADRIGDDRYELYFDDQTFQMEHGVLLVQAADEFTLERIRSQFQSDIEATINQVVGPGLSLTFAVAGQPRIQTSLFEEIRFDNMAQIEDAHPRVTTSALSPATELASQGSEDMWLEPNENEFPASPGFRDSLGRCWDHLSHSPQLSHGRPLALEGPYQVSENEIRRAAGTSNGDGALRQLLLFNEAGLADPAATGANTSHSAPAANVTPPVESQIEKQQPTTAVGNPSDRPVGSHASPVETNRSTASRAFAQGSRQAMNLATFQFGHANVLAKAAVDQVIQRPGMISPVVVHGPVGCGKTHLATGLAHQLRSTFRAFSVLQLSAEQFTSRFLEALNGSGLPSLRAKFRDMDLLILEDIQFFHGKKATIVELQHTLDALIKAGKQLVLTSDRHPNDLSFLGSEVQTRLVSGLVVSLNPADRDARANICRQWCARQGMAIDSGLVDWLADNVVGDVRRICGALFRVFAMQSSSGQMVSAATAMDLLSDYVSASHSICSLGQIQKVVCDVCGVDAKELNSTKRTRRVSSARMLAMFLARKHTQAALSEIGDFFGGRRHSTVLAAEKRIKSWEAGNELIDTGLQAVNTREVIRKVEAKLSAM